MKTKLLSPINVTTNTTDLVYAIQDAYLGDEEMFEFITSLEKKHASYDLLVKLQKYFSSELEKSDKED